MRFKLPFILLFIISCSGKDYRATQGDMIISAKFKGERSTTAGNLITSAMRQVHKLDVVLYPSEFIAENEAEFFEQNISEDKIENMLRLYPRGSKNLREDKDKFRLGYMSGRDIKTFIRQRSIEKFKVDFEVAGVSYDILMKGGMILSEQYGFENGALNEQRVYLVAISNFLMRPGAVFPPYMYRNSIDRIFSETNQIISARDSLKEFLQSSKSAPRLNRIRARVHKTKAQNQGEKLISEIQGTRFLSPFVGDIVTTTGIVTASAVVENAPYGHIAYIQTKTNDLNPKTSEGIKLYFEKSPKIKVGDLLKLTGTVYEESTNALNALTTTSLRDISSLKILSSNHSLPEAIFLKKIPSVHYSTYAGNLHLKPELDLKDAIDFYESFEGMRVKIESPRVVGFRGGKETLDDEKGHLTLFVIPHTKKPKLLTDKGGVYTKPDKHIYNPDILAISSGDLTPHLNLKKVYKVGDVIPGEIEGIITFTKNLFGEGEYLFQVPQKSEAIEDFNRLFVSENLVPLSSRPKLEGELTEDSLTIAAYNIKNLSAISKDKKRLRATGEMIHTNMRCPDVIGLVEIQDNNGEDFDGSSEAQKTLDALISFIPKEGDCAGVEYEAINVNPLSHREGGVPGANIRVAFIYNKNRLGFSENPPPTPLTETFILPSGHLNHNPGRIAPNSEAFRNTRKSVVAEFTFKGEPVFVIVNHFNSKISDTSYFSVMQPVVRNTEIKRGKLANVINQFVTRIEKYNPQANIAVLGDFNAYVNEQPMKILEGNNLYNMIRTLPRNEWYTTNHNGNSQSLDYIFVNSNLRDKHKSFQIPQVNSDFMGRLSDHDPVISIFNF